LLAELDRDRRQSFGADRQPTRLCGNGGESMCRANRSAGWRPARTLTGASVDLDGDVSSMNRSRLADCGRRPGPFFIRRVVVNTTSRMRGVATATNHLNQTDDNAGPVFMSHRCRQVHIPSRHYSCLAGITGVSSLRRATLEPGVSPSAPLPPGCAATWTPWSPASPCDTTRARSWTPSTASSSSRPRCTDARNPTFSASSYSWPNPRMEGVWMSRWNTFHSNRTHYQSQQRCGPAVLDVPLGNSPGRCMTERSQNLTSS